MIGANKEFWRNNAAPPLILLAMIAIGSAVAVTYKDQRKKMSESEAHIAMLKATGVDSATLGRVERSSQTMRLLYIGGVATAGAAVSAKAINYGIPAFHSSMELRTIPTVVGAEMLVSGLTHQNIKNRIKGINISLATRGQ